MKNFTLLLFISFFTLTFAQDKKCTYLQFDIAIPLKGNQNRGDENYNTNNNDSWFLPDGLSAKLGYGFHYNKYISLGIQTGIDWKGTEKLVVVPVFANVRVSPKIGEETRLYLQAGYGKSFAIGRGNLSGEYKKVSLGIENADGVSLFIEFAQHGFTLHQIENLNMLSVGISCILFEGKTIAPNPASE